MRRNYIYHSKSKKRSWGKRRPYRSSRYQKKRQIPWRAILWLLIVCALLIASVFYIKHQLINWKKVTTKINHKISETVKEAKPIFVNKKTENRKTAQSVKFGFYTMLPEMKVDVSLDQKDAENAPTTIKRKYYLLQIASFHTLEAAQDYQQQLKALGFETDLSKKQRGEVTWYRVQIGPFRSFQRAFQLRAQLKEQHINNVLITVKRM